MLTLEPLDPVDELLVVAVRAVVDVLLELVGGLLHVPLESHAHVLVAEPGWADLERRRRTLLQEGGEGELRAQCLVVLPLGEAEAVVVDLHAP